MTDEQIKEIRREIRDELSETRRELVVITKDLSDNMTKILVRMERRDTENEAIKKDVSAAHKKIRELDEKAVKKSVVYAISGALFSACILTVGALELYFNASSRTAAQPMHASMSKIEPIPFEQTTEVVL